MLLQEGAGHCAALHAAVIKEGDVQLSMLPRASATHWAAIDAVNAAKGECHALGCH